MADERVSQAGLKAEGVAWQLDELYAGPHDPRIEVDLAEARRLAERLADSTRGKISGGQLDGAALARALAEYEAVAELRQRPAFYASLLFAADTQNAAAGRLVQRTREAATAIENLLVFFSLELIELDDETLAWLLAAPELQAYRHYLDVLRRFKPHTLSEKEEQLVNRKNLSGKRAFEKLYDELSGSLRFSLTIDGESHVLTDGEVLALLRRPDPGLRERALSTFLETYARHELVLTTIFNNLLLDHKLECEQRGYADVTLPTHLSNEVAPDTVEAMLHAVERHYRLAQEYFRLKAGLLGVPRLAVSDVYAPLVAAPDDAGTHIPFDAARELILTAFRGFDDRFAELAAEFFARRWIDAEVRPGKRAGAFCASLSPGHHPYVLCSYTGTARDVSTVAHELGHGIHDMLARGQTLLQYDAPLVLAETASVFAEIVLTRHLLETSDNAAARRRVLCGVLEELYGTVFRQAALTRFEMAAHAKRREGQLGADDIGTLWLAEQERLFGDSVALPPVYRWGWTYIPHFIHSRFYCYSYPFGELLTLALYQCYLNQGAAFVPGYLELLAAGGSQPPEQALAGLGIDIVQPEFWEQAFGVVEGFLAELRASLATGA